MLFRSPLSNISVFKDAGGRGDCPNATVASETVFSIPCEPVMDEAQIQEVIETVKSCYTAALES